MINRNNLKILLFGDSGVGKTTLAQHLGAEEAKPTESGYAASFRPFVYAIDYKRNNDTNKQLIQDSYNMTVFDSCGLDGEYEENNTKINVLFKFIEFCKDHKDGFHIIFYVKNSRMKKHTKFNLELIRGLYPRCNLIVVNQGCKPDWHSSRCICPRPNYPHDNSTHFMEWIEGTISINLRPFEVMEELKEKKKMG